MKYLFAAFAGAALFLGAGIEVGTSNGSRVSDAPILITVSAADAQPARRVARRTARRTTRRTSARTNYYASLPGNCVLRSGYHYCGGVYYQPVTQNGATVYIIVTP